MATRIQVRRDTAANWTSANPTLAAAEVGFETDTGRVKVGDGSTAWTSLGYAEESMDVPSQDDFDTAALRLVTHGGTAGTSRPAGVARVLWEGTVEPDNGTAGDLLSRTDEDKLYRFDGTDWLALATEAHVGSVASAVIAAAGRGTVTSHDTFDRPDGAIGTADSGEAWTSHSGTWEVFEGQARCVSTAGVRTATIDAGSADGACALWLRAGGSAAVGMTFRLDDASNFLLVEFQAATPGFRISKFDAGSRTTLTSGSATRRVGEWYRIGARFMGDAISAVVHDAGGRQIEALTYTLTSGEQTKYGSLTRCGLMAQAADGERFDDFIVRGA